jgi:ATP-binding cassette subfamily F protein uup
MPLVTINDLHIGFRGPALLDGVTCRIELGQRIGLLGRNGAGKTTFMRILSGQIAPDHGEVTLENGARAALLPQDVPLDIAGAVRDIVATGLGGATGNLAEELADGSSSGAETENDHDHDAAWRAQNQVEQILSRMQLDPDALFETLSSGMKRRVLLARSLVGRPALLLLDEPTNHLDIAAIEWLETFLTRWSGTLLFVTHDRSFLRRMATRIFEIDRGRLFDWSCDYDTFLERKEQALAAEEKQNALFDKKLAQEEVWIRTGIKARRTRNEGRVRALEAMRRQRADRRTKTGTARIEIQEGQRSGALVADLDEVSFAYPNRPILSKFSTTIMRGDKLGIIGPNGTGKTTLLRLLLGQLPPQAGRVRLGTNLQIAYFDQLRQQLREEATVADNVGDGYETISVNGKPKHIIGYLQDFLFEPDRARTLVRFLSGGERNRVLLAKLFAKPANVIVLDEPTNDLDTETLELLEERLVEFGGTVLLVSHDRTFLNNVVTSSIVFDEGNVREYVGGYDDYLRQKAAQTPVAKSAAKPADRTKEASAKNADLPAAVPANAAVEPKRRLKYKEQQELASLPGEIERLEAEIAEFTAEMAQASFYQQPGEAIARRQARFAACQEELARAYDRWQELELLAP